MATYRDIPHRAQYSVDDWADTFAYGKTGYKGVDDGYQEAVSALHGYSDVNQRLGGPAITPLSPPVKRNRKNGKVE